MRGRQAMNNDTNGNIVAALLATPLAILALLWLVIAIVAAIVAPRGRTSTFFFLTLLLLGPVGVVAASIAQPRDPEYLVPPPRPVAPGRRRFFCPRCGVDNDIPDAVTAYECWRCGEHQNVEHSAAAVPPRPWSPASDIAGLLFGGVGRQIWERLFSGERSPVKPAATASGGPAPTRPPAASEKQAAAPVGEPLATGIESKLADFNSGRISLAEFEAFLNAAEGSLSKGVGPPPEAPRDT